MRILIIATKSPWPPRDGGRLVLWWTLQGLAALGHELLLLAPRDVESDAAHAETIAALSAVCTPHLIAATSRGKLGAMRSAFANGHSYSVARHAQPLLRDAARALIAALRPDLVHVEQLQALANAEAANDAGVPVVLRMQNVESSLWRQIARARWYARPLALEAARVARDEQAALRQVTMMLTLSAADAQALGSMARALPPACPAELAAGPALPGDPAIALIGSAGWWPNRDALQWFLRQVIGPLSAACPNAVVHVFGGVAEPISNVQWHAPPEDAATAFPQNAIVAVPLRIGSGIRMRIVEAFARGLPVVASSVAAVGLDIQHNRELLIADDGVAFAQAIARLRDPALRARLVEAGRDYLLRTHAMVDQSEALFAAYREAIATHTARAAR